MLVDCGNVFVVQLLLLLVLASGRNSNDALVTDRNIHGVCLLRRRRRWIRARLESQLKWLLLLLLDRRHWRRLRPLSSGHVRLSRWHNIKCARPQRLWTKNDPIIVHLRNGLRGHLLVLLVHCTRHVRLCGIDDLQTVQRHQLVRLLLHYPALVVVVYTGRQHSGCGRHLWSALPLDRVHAGDCRVCRSWATDGHEHVLSVADHCHWTLCCHVHGRRSWIDG